MTDEEIEHYKTKGWVVLKNVIPNDLLQIVKEEGQKLRERYNEFQERQVWYTKHITCASIFSEKLGDCYTAPFILDILKNILVDNIWLYFDQINYKLASDNFNFPKHCDNFYCGEQLQKGDVHSVNIDWVLDDFTETSASIDVFGFSDSFPIEGNWETLYPKSGDLIITNGNCFTTDYMSNKDTEPKSNSERIFYSCLYTDQKITSSRVYKVQNNKNNKFRELDYYKNIKFSEPNLTKLLYNLI
jgi:hypothetical protein